MARKKDKRIELGADADRPEGTLTHNPFAAWARHSQPTKVEVEVEVEATGRRDAESSGPGPVTERTGASELAGVSARLRHERKGHGGKTVTVIEFERGDAPVDLAESARAIGKAMGTRARVVGDTIVVQGDVRDRLERYLEGTLAMRVRRAT